MDEFQSNNQDTKTSAIVTWMAGSSMSGFHLGTSWIGMCAALIIYTPKTLFRVTPNKELSGNNKEIDGKIFRTEAMENDCAC